MPDITAFIMTHELDKLTKTRFDARMKQVW